MLQSTTRETILKAAEVRFGHYGFSKTTMAEIARDCHMSAANIYRHFDGKNDILAVLAARLFKNQEESLTKILASPASNNAERIHTFFQEALQITWQYATAQPRMKEMVDFICRERFDLVQAQSDTKNRFIASIFTDGVLSGEFNIEDIDSTTRAFKEATVMFHTPIFMDMYSFDELSISCHRILDLLLGSITKAK